MMATILLAIAMLTIPSHMYFFVGRYLLRFSSPLVLRLPSRPQNRQLPHEEE